MVDLWVTAELEPQRAVNELRFKVPYLAFAANACELDYDRIQRANRLFAY